VIAVFVSFRVPDADRAGFDRWMAADGFARVAGCRRRPDADPGLYLTTNVV
jgi:hypothetical protein